MRKDPAPFTERAICVAIAFVALIEARLRLTLTGDAEITAFLMSGGIPRRRRPGDGTWLRTFAWALQGVARRMPFRSDCLIRVLAADRVLSLRDWPSEIHLQAGQRPEGFTSHACLSCDGVDLTGGAHDDLGMIAG